MRYTQYTPGVLTNGLEILRLLAEAEGPLTATAIAERVGLHPSNVSRTLRVLMKAGYVRKPTYHSFVVDLGVLALAGTAVRSLPLITRTAAGARAMAERRVGSTVALAVLFRDEVLYLHRARHGEEPVVAEAGGWPLHRSVVGLRLLADLPKGEAIEALKRSARRYGWERPTAKVPGSPAECLAAVKAAMDGDVLTLSGWERPGFHKVAVRVGAAGYPPLALSLDGDDPVVLQADLEQGARALTNALENP